MDSLFRVIGNNAHVIGTYLGSTKMQEYDRNQFIKD